VDAKRAGGVDNGGACALVHHTHTQNISRGDDAAMRPDKHTSADDVTALTQEQLAMIVALAADAIIAVDGQHRIIFFNDGAAQIFGHAAADMIGQPLGELLPERLRARHTAHIHEFAGARERARLMGERERIIGLRSSGEEFPAEASIAKAPGNGEQVYLVVLRDVTEQATARADLAEHQRQLEEAQRIASLGSWEWDVGSDRFSWSDELCRIYGVQPGMAQTDIVTFLEYVHPADRQGMRAAIERALDGGDAFEIEERIIRRDGSVRLLRSRGSVVRDAAGAPQRLLGVCQDITEQRLVEEQALQLTAEQAARAAAEAGERRMSFLAKSSAELASSLDPAVTLRTVARLAVPAIADWAAVDMVDAAGAFQRLAVEHADPARAALVHEIERRYPPDPDDPYGVRRVMRTGESVFLPHVGEELLKAAAQDAEHARLIRRLGLRSYICVPLIGREGMLGAITLAYAESGREYGALDLLMAEDLGRRAAIAVENATLVAQLHAAHERLQQQAHELEAQAEELEGRNVELEAQARELARLDRTRSDFMATISHELRTPLNAIIGYSDLLAEGIPVAVPEPARRHAGRIRLGADHLLRLIEEILSFSSLEAGRQRPTFEDLATSRLVDELQAVIEPLAGQRGLEFRIVVGDAPDRLRTDPNRLRQILLNLLANAVKFTDEGHIELEIARLGGDVVFSVRDTGIGIRAEEQRFLFEPFWQADQSLTRRMQGAGLGLAIADRLTRLIGGAITVTSALGEGTEFRLQVPLSYTTPTEPGT
jgi:PAS domain S-box-containing protein